MRYYIDKERLQAQYEYHKGLATNKETKSFESLVDAAVAISLQKVLFSLKAEASEK